MFAGVMPRRRSAFTFLPSTDRWATVNSTRFTLSAPELKSALQQSGNRTGQPSSEEEAGAQGEGALQCQDGSHVPAQRRRRQQDNARALYLHFASNNAQR